MATATRHKNPGSSDLSADAYPISTSVMRLVLAVAGMAGYCTDSVFAQTNLEPGTRRAWSIVPRVGVTQTFTDNVDLSGTAKQADQLTEIAPGIRVQADSARIKAYVDYALRNFVSANDSSRNRSQNALTSFGTFEAVEKWLFIDASGSISQQTISAFGTQSPSGANTNANSTETSTFRLSPYVRGKLGTFAGYDARYARSETRSSSALAANVESDDITAQLNGTFTGPLSWSLNGSRQVIAYGSGIKNEADRLGSRLNYRYDAELSGFISLGTEANNYSTSGKTSYSNSGFGGEWSPTERTKLSASRERRSFGNSHSITFTHRTPLSAWRFTDSRSVTALPNQSSSTGLGTYYDLFNSQLASSVPDPVARAQQVNNLLQQSGISPNAVITQGFLTSRLTVQRRQDLSFTLNGLRNTVTYTLFQTDSQSLSAGGPSIADDFSRSALFKTRGMSSNFSHRLTPFSSLNMLSSWSRVSGAAGGLTSTQKTFNLNVSSRFSPKLNGTLGVRATIFDGSVNAYRENAIVGTVTAQF